MSVTEPPQFTVRVSGLTLPPVPADPVTVHWLSANVTLTGTVVALPFELPTVTVHFAPVPLQPPPVQPETW